MNIINNVTTRPPLPGLTKYVVFPAVGILLQTVLYQYLLGYFSDMPSVPVDNAKSSKTKRDIADFLENNDIESALNVLREGLKATKTNRYRDPQKPKGIQYGKVPDHNVRYHSAKLMLEYGFGKPATRAEIEVKDSTSKSASPHEILKKIQNSAHSFREIADTYINSIPSADIQDD